MFNLAKFQNEHLIFFLYITHSIDEFIQLWLDIENIWEWCLQGG